MTLEQLVYDLEMRVKKLEAQAKSAKPIEQVKSNQQGHYDSQGYCDNPARGY